MLAFVGLFAGWLYWEKRQDELALQEVLAQWDKEGPWRWKDWLASRPRPPAEENGMQVVEEMHRLRPRHVENEDSYLLFDDVYYRCPQHLLHAEQVRELRDRGIKCKDALALMPLYASKKIVVWPIPEETDPIRLSFQGLQHSRELVSDLHDRFQVYLHDGQIKKAVEQIDLSLLMVRNMDHQLTAIGKLVQVALLSTSCSQIQRLLALSEPDDALLARLQSTLQRFDEQHSWKQMVRIEVGFVDRLIHDLQDGIVDINVLSGGFFGDGAGNKSESWIGQQYEKVTEYFQNRALLASGQHAECLRAMLTCYQKSQEPWSVQWKYWTAFDERLKQERTAGRRRLIHLLIPAMGKIVVAQVQVIAALRTAQLALAAERFRRAENRWPTSQAELVGRFLDVVQIDPYDDQPIRMKRTADGLIVYSIGKNGVDDQGMVLPTEEQRMTLDTGVRLWDVKGRRQAALPLSESYLKSKEEAKEEK